MTRPAGRRISAPLLVLDVDGLRVEVQQLARCDDWIALFRVVLVEDLEARELHRLRRDVIAIRIVLEPGLAPAVHVYYDLHPGIELDVLVAGNHRTSKAMYDQHLRRQI